MLSTINTCIKKKKEEREREREDEEKNTLKRFITHTIIRASDFCCSFSFFFFFFFQVGSTTIPQAFVSLFSPIFLHVLLYVHGYCCCFFLDIYFFQTAFLLSVSIPSNVQSISFFLLYGILRVFFFFFFKVIYFFLLLSSTPLQVKRKKKTPYPTSTA